MAQIDIAKVIIFRYIRYTTNMAIEPTNIEEVTKIIDPKLSVKENKTDKFFALKPRKFEFSVDKSENSWTTSIYMTTSHQNFPDLTELMVRAYNSIGEVIFEGIISLQGAYEYNKDIVKITAYDPIVLFADTKSQLSTDILESSYTDPYLLQEKLIEGILDEYFITGVERPDYDTSWSIPDWGLGDNRDVYDWGTDIVDFYNHIKNTYIDSAEYYFDDNYGETLASTHDFSRIDVYRWRYSGSLAGSVSVEPLTHPTAVAVEFVGIICFVSNTGRKYICSYHKGYVHNWKDEITGCDDVSSMDIPWNSTDIEILEGAEYEDKPLFFCNYFASRVDAGKLTIELRNPTANQSSAQGPEFVLDITEYHALSDFFDPFKYSIETTSGDFNERPVWTDDMSPFTNDDIILLTPIILEYGYHGEDLWTDVQSVIWSPVMSYDILNQLDSRRRPHWMTYSATMEDYIDLPQIYSPERMDSTINNVTNEAVKNKAGIQIYLKGAYSIPVTRKYDTFSFTSAYGRKHQESLFTKGQIALGWYKSDIYGYTQGWNSLILREYIYQHMAFQYIKFYTYEVQYNETYPLTTLIMDNKPLYKKGNISNLIKYLPDNVISKGAFTTAGGVNYDFKLPNEDQDSIYYTFAKLFQFFLASMNLYGVYENGVFEFKRMFDIIGSTISIADGDVMDWETQSTKQVFVDASSILKPTVNYTGNALNPFYDKFASLDNQRATCKISRLFTDYDIVLNSKLTIMLADWKVDKLDDSNIGCYDVELTKLTYDPT